MVSVPVIGLMKKSKGKTGSKEGRLEWGKKRVELQIFTNPTVGSPSRPCVLPQIKTNGKHTPPPHTHTLTIHI